MFALACALLVPIATAMPVAAQSPTLTQSGGPTSGPPGTVITYTYSYGDDCANITRIHGRRFRWFSSGTASPGPLHGRVRPQLHRYA